MRLPIQKGLLTILVNHVRQKYLQLGQEYLAALYPALLSTAYYGLLRVGEVTTGSHPILAPDVHIGNNKNKCFSSYVLLKPIPKGPNHN